MQQKVSICAALITNPKVILFDEPMIGLDPKAIKELKKFFRIKRKRNSSDYKYSYNRQYIGNMG